MYRAAHPAPHYGSATVAGTITELDGLGHAHCSAYAMHPHTTADGICHLSIEAAGLAGVLVLSPMYTGVHPEICEPPTSEPQADIMLAS